MTNPYESPTPAKPDHRRKFRVNRTLIFGLALPRGFVSMLLLVGGHAFYVETLGEPGTLRSELANYFFLSGQVGIAVTLVLWCWAFVPYLDQHRLDDVDPKDR